MKTPISEKKATRVQAVPFKIGECAVRCEPTETLDNGFMCVRAGALR